MLCPSLTDLVTSSSSTTLIATPTAPEQFIETLIVRVKLKERLSINVRKSDNTVTRIDKISPLYSRIMVGDRILKLNDEPFTTETLFKMLQIPKSNDSTVRGTRKTKELVFVLDHASFSWSKLRRTTLESILYDKDQEKCVGRAVNMFLVALYDRTEKALQRRPIGMKIRYDARERVEICHVSPNSLAAVHLRPGDIIRMVNGRPVTTKTMCTMAILESLATGRKVTLTVETPVNGPDSYREHIDIPEDTVAIGKKQIEFLKSGYSMKQPLSILVQAPPLAKSTPNDERARGSNKKSTNPQRVSISGKEHEEFPHYVDMDVTKLRNCKNAK